MLSSSSRSDAGIADADRKAVALFDRVGHRPAGQGDFDLVLNVLDRDAVAGRRLAVDVDLQIALAHDRRGDHVAGAVDRLERRFDVLADAVDRVQVGAEDLDADVGAHAGREHFDAVDDRLGEDVAPAGHLQHAAHFVVDQIALGAGLPRPEKDAVLANGCLQLFAQRDERLETHRRRRACPSCTLTAAAANASVCAPCVASATRPAFTAALTTSSRAYQV